MKSEKGGWANWPNKDYAREMDDVFQVGARCDAWRAFVNSPVLHKLNKLKGHIIHFNRYEYFDTLICEFSCTERALRNALQRLMRPGHEQPVTFKRNDIYDSRAWCWLPLSCFAPAEGFNPRTLTERRQEAVLEGNEMPMLQIGLRDYPLQVTSDCFFFSHRIKHGERVAEMTFTHPDLDPRFKNHRWVADKKFPRSATRAEMHADLLNHVRTECAKHHVRIVDLDVIDRLHGEPIP